MHREGGFRYHILQRGSLDWLFGFPIRYQFKARHEPLASYLPDDRMLLMKAPKTSHKLVSTRSGVCPDAALTQKVRTLNQFRRLRIAASGSGKTLKRVSGKPPIIATRQDGSTTPCCLTARADRLMPRLRKYEPIFFLRVWPDGFQGNPRF
jgi:hypothetical protein